MCLQICAKFALDTDISHNYFWNLVWIKDSTDILDLSMFCNYKLELCQKSNVD